MPRPIELYLVRHAIAAARGEKWPDDRKRPLTAKGIARFREVVEGLRQLDVIVDVILTSPLVRARQTAELLAAGLAPHPSVQLVDALAPGAAPPAVTEAIGRLKQRRVACVGHEPDLGRLAAHLVGAKRPFEFKKGAVCRIDLDTAAGPGRLAFLAPPGLMRRAGR